jgi:hypothetical protein
LPFLGLCIEKSLNNRDFLGFQQPAVVIGEQLFYLCQAVSGKTLKLHRPPQICILPKKEGFWGIPQKA